MRLITIYFRIFLLFSGVFLLGGSRVFAFGEIVAVRAPDELPEGEDMTIIISATAREKDVNRSVVLSIPRGWQIVRAWAVEGGSDELRPLPENPFVEGFYSAKPGYQIYGVGDTSTAFDAGAQGVVYFFTFSTKSVPGSDATIQATLVERWDPQAALEIDKKTKRPKERDIHWQQVSPKAPNFSFEQSIGRKFSAQSRVVKGWKSTRGLVLNGPNSAYAALHTRVESLQQFFGAPFSLEFWINLNEPDQTILDLKEGDGRAGFEFSTNAFGLLRFQRVENRSRRTILTGKMIVSDGEWHHIAVSLDSQRTLRLFIDGLLSSSAQASPKQFETISMMTLGNQNAPVAFAIDELRMLSTGYVQAADFIPRIGLAARDTLRDAFAIFHFEDYAGVARSSVPLRVRNEGRKPDLLPIVFNLDSNARFADITSPVQAERVVLTAELVAPTKVGINWRTMTELGVKEYVLQRRVGSFGKYEDILTNTAQFGVAQIKRGQPLVHRSIYNAAEDLPRLNGTVDLYYRVVAVGFNGEEEVSEPVKIEYGGSREVFVEQNDPNPFNPTTTIAFTLAKPTVAKLAVYDIIGREVGVVFSGRLDAGRHKFSLDATNWPGGIYFYKVKTINSTVTRKMVLAK